MKSLVRPRIEWRMPRARGPFARPYHLIPGSPPNPALPAYDGVRRTRGRKPDLIQWSDRSEPQGWSGFVFAARRTTFVPEGESGWEMGTSLDPAKKVNGDNQARVENPCEVDPARTTFVFVKSPRWAKKLGAERVVVVHGARRCRAIPDGCPRAHAHLGARQIQTRLLEQPIHQSKPYRGTTPALGCPVSERLHAQALSVALLGRTSSRAADARHRRDRRRSRGGGRA